MRTLRDVPTTEYNVMDSRQFTPNKPLLAVMVGIVLILFVTLFNAEETIRIQSSLPKYAGEWKRLQNRSHAIVSIRNDEQYDIRYTGTACKMIFVGTICTIDIEKSVYEILKLDIDKDRSNCYFLNSLFSPSQFIFKIEALSSHYAKLKLPSLEDLEVYLEHAEGSDAVKENLQSMITLLKTKSGALQKMEQYILEYEKKE